MTATPGSQVIKDWPAETREPAQLVIDQHGEPDETTESALVWHRRGPWKRIVATKAAYLHNFPLPHMDSVESFVDYRVPVDKFTLLAQFDGSVIAERTTGETSARCHDLANSLALNLMHDLVTGAKNVQQVECWITGASIRRPTCKAYASRPQCHTRLMRMSASSPMMSSSAREEGKTNAHG